MVNQVFQLDRPVSGEPTYGSVVLPSGDYAVISLTAVRDGDPASSDKSVREALRTSLERGLGDDAFGGFLQALRAGTSIETFAESLE